MAVAAIGWGASAASAAPPAALVSSTLTLAATGTTVGTLAATGSTAAGLSQERSWLPCQLQANSQLSSSVRREH